MRSQSPTSRSTQYETSFYWPATLGAKSGGIRKLKTTIQTTFCHRCSPHLYSAIDSDCIFYWPATLGAKPGGIRKLKTTIQTTFCHLCSPLFSRATFQRTHSSIVHVVSIRRNFTPHSQIGVSFSRNHHI